MQQTLEPILKEHSFFAGLRPEHMALVVGCASNVKFEAGSFIFREGEEANQFYIVREGRVAIEMVASRRRGITIETLGRDDVLGWSWLVSPYKWHFNARVVDATRAIALDAKCLREKCLQDHELGYELLSRVLHVIEQRLQATRMQLLDVYSAQS
jgi:CRP/FNR family transcriptional regulator, cyclic AMP receptor protein